MAMLSLTAAADALEDHLDRERKLILAGEIDGLLRASAEKERLLARLPGSGDNAETFARLRRKADRNQQLLLAAARGLKAAAKRMETLKTPATGLRTYGRDGAAATLGNSRRGVNHQV
ncbi:MAG: hypothetical protein CSA74_02650 [Rhodobacterales bacterium]|nr:MAG: hypothetical protein CSA74_02650 [Rhodobacterales bacterium]